MSRNVQTAAEEALELLATRDHDGQVIDILLPLLRAPKGITLTTHAPIVRILGALRLGKQTDQVIEQLLPLLDPSADFDDQVAASEALVSLASGDDSGQLIDRLLPFVESSDAPHRDTQNATARALRAVPYGEHSNRSIDRYLLRLESPDGKVRKSAVQVLGSIQPGNRAGELIDRLLPLLKSSSLGIQIATVEALATITKPNGDHVTQVINALLPLLEPSSEVGAQKASLRALAAIHIPPGDSANQVIERLLPLLGPLSASDVQSAAAEALTAIPISSRDRVSQAIDRLLLLLGSSSKGYQQKASLRALAAIHIPPGDSAYQVIERLLPLLGSSSKADVQAAAISALGAIPLGNRADVVIYRLIQLLASPLNPVRGASARALGVIQITPGRFVDEAIDGLLPLLAVEDGNVHRAVREALLAIPIPPGKRASVLGGIIGHMAFDDDEVRPTEKSILTVILREDFDEQVLDNHSWLLLAQNPTVRTAVAEALVEAGPRGGTFVLSVLRHIHEQDAQFTPLLRAIGHVATGEDNKHEGSVALLSWLGKPDILPLASVTNSPDAAHAIFKNFKLYWPAITASAGIREEAETRILAIVYAACSKQVNKIKSEEWVATTFLWARNQLMPGTASHCWSKEQQNTLESLLVGVPEAGYQEALRAVLRDDRGVLTLKWLTWGLFGWFIFWVAFLFAFPWSRTVQALFFWNPKVRNMMSLWFVPAVLLILPPLRRRLLIPFREDLVAAARLEDLPKLAFFGQSRVRSHDNQSLTLEMILQDLRGVVIIRGDAGLGKTTALRCLAARSTRPVAFLAARDCAGGVDVAIARLIRDVQDIGFVRSMVHAGALSVIVDGLNEVSADTREKISGFAKDMSRGDVFIGTQPIEWTPPPSALVVDLLPLERVEAERFLLSRPVRADCQQRIHGDAYVSAVETFVRRALDQAPSDEEQRAATLVLSNPFDLTLAADLLAQGSMPSAIALIDEAFRLADVGAPGEPGYRDIAGQSFPLVRFGRLAVAMRIEDRNWFKPDDFASELPFLLRRRLLVERAVRGLDGSTVQRIQFRHDRIWDFFVAAAFLDDPNLWDEHLSDPRFRGAYLRIAETWPPAAAAKVRDRLIVAAAERGDHSTSDEFIARLEARKSLRPTGSVGPTGATGTSPTDA